MEEVIFYDDGFAKVTSARFVTRDLTFSVSAITYVQVLAEKPGTYLAYVLGLVGLLLVLLKSFWCIPLFAAAAFFVYFGEKQYCIQLGAHGTKNRALAFQSKDYVEDIVHFINLAIAHRG